MNVGPFQILIIALVLLILFGRGRISETMGGFGEGIKSFRKGMADDGDAAPGSRAGGLGDEANPASDAAADVQPAPDPTLS